MYSSKSELKTSVVIVNVDMLACAIGLLAMTMARNDALASGHTVINVVI